MMDFVQQRTRVKICGLTRIDDVRSAIAAGADSIGLVFYEPSPRAVSIEEAIQLAKIVPAFVTVTALFVDPDPEFVKEVIQRVDITLLQFHGDEPEQFCAQFGRPYIKAIRVSKDTDLISMAERYSSAKALLLDTYRQGVPGGTGETFDWNLIPESLSKPVILAGGLSSKNVVSAICSVRPYAIDVSGGVESAKGIKSNELIVNLMNEVSCANEC